MIHLALLAALCTAPHAERTAWTPMAPVLRAPAACQAPREEVGPVVVRREERRT